MSIYKISMQQIGNSKVCAYLHEEETMVAQTIVEMEIGGVGDYLDCAETAIQELRYIVEYQSIFNWEKFYNDEQIVYCTSERDAELFCAYLHGKGIKWKSGDSPIELIHWDRSCSYVPYQIVSGALISCNRHSNNQIEIHFTKEMLEGN